MQIIRGKLPGAKKVVIYGPEGIGKSTFAACFPNPLFIDTEGSTRDMEVARTKPPSSWTMLNEQVRAVITDTMEFKTLVIDTADWAEQLCVALVCSKFNKDGIEEFGYGKGYTYVQEEFGKLLNLLSELAERKAVNIVLTAHAKMRKFEQPDELGTYDRWEMKLTKQVAPMIKEWADMVLFANYKTLVYNVDGQGAQKGKNKARGGQRILYTTHHPCWDAKNRYGLPEEVPFEYKQIVHIVEGQNQDIYQEKESVNTSIQEPRNDVSVKSRPEPEKITETAAHVEDKPGPITEQNIPITEVNKAISKALRDLMIENNVDEWDIQNVVAARGYYPLDTPVMNYDEAFIQAKLVGKWPQVYAMIKEMKKTDSLVFN